MLPLATNCHTHYYLHPFHFMLFKLKDLVAKQQPTNTHTLTHACTCMHTHVDTCTQTWTHAHMTSTYTHSHTQSYSSGVPKGDSLVCRAGAEGIREWQKPHCIHRVCMAPQCNHTLTTSMYAHGDKSLIASNISLFNCMLSYIRL